MPLPSLTRYLLGLATVVLATGFFAASAQAGVIVQRPLFIGLDKGLVGWWTFDGKDMAQHYALDRSGNGNRGALNTTSVTQTFSTLIPVGASDVTIETWGAGGGGGGQNLGSDGGSGGGGGGYSRSVLSAAGTTLTLSIGDGGAGQAGTNGVPGGDPSTGTPPTTGHEGGQASCGVGQVTFSGGNGGDGRNNNTGTGGGGGGSGEGSPQTGGAGADGQIKLTYTMPDPQRVPGKIGQALQFDGVDDYVGLGNILQFTSSFSVMAWVYPESTDYENPIVNKTGGTGARDWRLTEECGNYFFQVVDAGGNQILRYATSLTKLRAWTHIAGVYNAQSQTLDIYVNGVRDNGLLSGAIPSAIQTTGNNVRIGGRELNSAFYGGLIDDVRIYNRALSPDEIKRLYKVGATAKANITLDGPQSGLVGHWSFDGPALALDRAPDSSGNGNEGRLTNGPERAAGKIGQGVAFDGADDYVNAGSGSSLNITGNITLAAWIKPNAVNSDHQIISKAAGIGNSSRAYYVRIEAGWITFMIVQSGVEKQAFTQAPTTPVGQWTHILATYDGSQQRIYVNGVLDNATPLTGSIDAEPTGNLHLGILFPTVERFNGLLDDVRIYNRALSADEIKRLYKIGATAKMNTTQTTGSLEKGLVGHWSFDGPALALGRAPDMSGNGNEGKLINGPVRAAGKIGQGLEFDGSTRVHLDL